ncbi:MAG: C1 family peptidase [Undibacterium sp.]
MGNHVGTVPARVDNEPYFPPVKDQSRQGACVGFATNTGIEARMNYLNTPVEPLSNQGTYVLARCVDRVPTANGVLPPLEDEGSRPNQAMRALTEWGIPLLSKRPDDDDTVNDEPTLDEIESAAKFRVKGQYEIKGYGKDRIDQIKNALAQGFPLCFAVMVDTAFEEWDGRSPIGLPDPADILGGHYLCAMGYDTTHSGLIEVKFMNSWGVKWGSRGVGHGNEDFIRGMASIYAMDIEVIK